MRVGIDLRPLRQPMSGGVVQFVEDLCPALFAQGADGSFVVYYADDGYRLPGPVPEHVRQVVLPDESPLTFDVALASDGIDVLFRSYPFDDALTFPAGRRFVFLADLQHEDHPEFFTAAELARRRRAFTAAIMGGGAVGVLTRHTEERLRAHFPGASAKVVQLPPGPPTLQAALAAPLSAEERRAIPDGPFFLYPANLWEHKNHRQLFLAFERFLAAGHESFSLVLTGSTVDDAGLLASAAGLPVRHLGFVSRRLQAELYRRCVALVYFSLYEGFGLPLLEAFQLGAPVLCSDTTGLAEAGGDAALRCDPTDVKAMIDLMERVANSPDLRSDVIQRGRAQLARHTWERPARNLLDALRDLDHADPRHDHALGVARLVSETLASRDREIDELRTALHERSAWGEQAVQAADERLDVIRAQQSVIDEMRQALDEWTARGASMVEEYRLVSEVAEERLRLIETLHDQGGEAQLPDGDELLVSVVIPIPDNRGHALRSIRSWALAQSFPRGRYEVIVLGDGAEPELEAQVRALLTPHDRFILEPGAGEIELYALGAGAARGRWIVFTESHCMGDRDCIAELVRFLARTGVDVAACRSIGVGSNHMARMEGRAFKQVGATRLAPGHWSKMFLRGSAVSREAYLAVGGLAWRYGLFGEPELAARLHAHGYRLGYAQAARVRHFNTTRFVELSESIHAYVHGETLYRQEHPDGESDRYFGRPEWWQQRSLLDAAVERNLWWSLRSTLGEPDAGRGERWQRWLGLLPTTVLGPRGHRWLADGWVGLARARCWWWRHDDDRLFPAYRDLWAGLARQAGIDALVSSDVPVEPHWKDEYALADIPETWMTGFHLVEELDGERFRWSGPVACLKLPLDAADRVLRLRTRGLRPRPGLRAFLNGRRLTIHDCQAEHGEIRLMLGPRHVKPGPFQYLVLVCEPLRPWLQGVDDRRELGLPLFSVARDRTYDPGLSPSADNRSSTKRRTSPATSSARSESASSYASAGTPPGSVVG